MTPIRLSIECATGRHGACYYASCDCSHHRHVYRDDWKMGAAITFLTLAVMAGLLWIQLTSFP